MLAHRSHPKAPSRGEEPDLDEDHRDVHEVDDEVLLEEHRTDDGDLREHGDRDVGQARRVVPAVGVLGEESAVQEAGEPDDEHVEHDADDHLIDEVASGEHSEQDSDEGPRDGRGDEAEVGIRRERADHGSHEGAGKQLSLDVDVDDAGPLAQHAAHGAEDQRHGQEEGALEQAGHREPLVRRDPREEGHDQGGAHDHGRPHDAAPAHVEWPGREGGDERDDGEGCRRSSGVDLPVGDLEELLAEVEDEGGHLVAGSEPREEGAEDDRDADHDDRAPRRHRCDGWCLDGGSDGGAHPFHPFASDMASPDPPRMRKIDRTSAGAAMKRTMSAWRTRTMSMGVPV